MATLTSTKIKNTYDALLKSIDNDAIGTTAKQITDGLGNVTPLYVSTTQVGIGVTPESGLNLHVFGDAKIGSNLTVIGNLVVEGSTTTVGTDTLTVKDPLIVLANNNTSTDAVDIGFYGKYTPSGTTLYSGLFREALTGKYRLFKGLEDEPTTTVNTSGTGYAKADLVIGDLEAERGTFTDSIFVSPSLYVSDAILHTGDIDTKLEFLSDQIKFSTGGSFRLSINNSYSEFFTNVRFGDGIKAQFGDSQDLEIYHNGLHGYLTNDTGNFEIATTGNLILQDASTNKWMMTNQGGGVLLYYNGGTAKLSTTPTGITVTGTIISDGLDLGDSEKIRLGDSQDLEIFHNNQDAYIHNNTGVLRIENDATNQDILFQAKGAVSLEEYIRIDGSDSLTKFSKDTKHIDNVKAIFGQDLEIYHNSADSKSYITQASGDLMIINYSDDNDVMIQCDDGSGGVTTYLKADGSTGAVQLNHYGVARLYTSSTGIQINGRISDLTDPSAAQDAATKAYVDSQIGSNNELSEVLANGNTTGGTDIAVSANDDITFTNTSKAIFNTALEISEDGSSGGVIKHDGTGGLVLKSDAVNINGLAGGVGLQYVEGGAISLRHNNSLKLATTSTGVSVTGEIVVDGTTSAIANSGVTLKRTGVLTGDADILLAGISGSEALTFRVNDSEKVRIQDNGNVGIGTDSPSQKLHVVGNIRVTGAYYDSNNSSGTADQVLVSTGTGTDWQDLSDISGVDGTGATGQVAFWTDTDTISGENNLYWDSTNDRLGIGTTTIGARLEVAATATTGVDIAYFSNSNSVQKAIFKLSDAGAGQLVLRDAGNVEDVLISSHGDSYFNGGNVGIGTSSPTNLLHIKKTGFTRGTFETDGDNQVGIQIIRSNSSNNTNWEIYSPAASTDLRFYNGGDRVTLDSSGNATFAGTISTASNIKGATFRSSRTDGDLYLQCKTSSDFIAIGNETSANLVRITGGGNVGIGTTSPARQLEVVSSSGIVTVLTSTTAGSYISMEDSSTTSDSQVRFGAIGNNAIIKSGGVTALTLDTSQNATFAGDVYILGNGKVLDLASDNYLRLGDNQDLQIVHTYSGGDSIIDSFSGEFKIRQRAQNTNLTFGTYVGDAMVIDGSGNVGIGTSSPSQSKLVVDGTISIPRSEGFQYLESISGGFRAGIFSTNTNDTGVGFNSLRFFVNADSTNPAMVIGGSTNNKNVGIGTTSPSEKLTIQTSFTTSASDSYVEINSGHEASGGSDVTGVAGLLFKQAGSGNVLRNAGSIISGREGNYSADSLADSYLVLKTAINGTNTERMRITSGGNVGIGEGTTNPAARLEISTEVANGGGQLIIANRSQDATATPTKRAEIIYKTTDTVGTVKDSAYVRVTPANQNNTTGSSYAIWTRKGNVNPTESMRIDSSGNVGIGTTNPIGKLEVRSSVVRTSVNGGADELVLQNAGYSGMTILASNTTAAQIHFGDDAMSNTGMIQYWNNTNSMTFSTNGGSEKMRIDSSGNVGIGTDSPDAKLHVNSGTSNTVALFESTDAAAKIFVKDNSTSNDYSVGIGAEGDDLTFHAASGGTERMRIDSSGDILIKGTYNPYTATNRGNITLNGSAGNIIAFTNNTSGKGYIFHDSTDLKILNAIAGNLTFSTNSTERMRIDSSGNVGIGLTSPTYKFHVASSNNVSIFEDTSGSSGATFCLFNAPSVFAMGSITRNGSATSVLFNTSSDYRLKEDLQDFNALDLVDNITAYDYKWKDTEQRDYGFVAHELQEVMPNVVSGEKDGEEMQKVDYSKLTPVLLKAIQELKAEIEILKTQINK